MSLNHLSQNCGQVPKERCSSPLCCSRFGGAALLFEFWWGRGLSPEVCAELLDVSMTEFEDAVWPQGHVKNILAKLSAHDRTEAVAVAIRRGIVHLD